jgi:hypothetical protein
MRRMGKSRRLRWHTTEGAEVGAHLQQFLAMSFLFSWAAKCCDTLSSARIRHAVHSSLPLQKCGLFYRWVSDWRMMGTNGDGIAKAFRFHLSYTFYSTCRKDRRLQSPPSSFAGVTLCNYFFAVFSLISTEFRWLIGQ